MITVYTLKTCDTCKKALQWLDEHAIAYENRDVRADGLDRGTIKKIVTAIGGDKAMNRRSTTWFDEIAITAPNVVRSDLVNIASRF
ncbi:MAG: glutaredoxin domain-containing protein, partial [Pseudomonadota bacterium]